MYYRFSRKPKSKRFIPKYINICYNLSVWNVYDTINKVSIHNNHININSGMDALNQCNKLNILQDDSDNISPQ
ncbi:MAG: hypothetical protein ACJA2M_000792 [Polaribacter sp.]|jgi:hypothetical protein